MIAPYVVQERNLKNVALIYVDDPAGEAVHKELAENIPKAGGTMVAQLQIPRAAQQFTRSPPRSANPSPDIVFVASFGAQQVQIIKQLRDNGVSPAARELLGVLLAVGGRAARGQGCAVPDAVGELVRPGDEPARGQGLEGQDRQGANAYVANYYNAVMVFVKLAQQLEKSNQPITGENLLKLRKANGTFDLVGGKMEFLPNGSVSMPIQINEVDGGAGKMVKAGTMPQVVTNRTTASTRAASPTPHQRSAARRDLRADRGRLLADLRRDQGVPRRARRGVHHRRLPVLVCLAVLKLGWPLAALVAIVAAVVFGLAMERFVYRPIQRHEGAFFTVFIAAFGVQIIVQNLIGTVFGRGFVSVTTTLSRSVEVLPGLYIAPVAWISILVAVVVFTVLTLYLARTHIGMAMRALSENPDLIRVFGLDPGRVAQFAFGIGSAIVVPGAILTAMTAGLNPAIGAHVMLISLAATIVGGIGSLRGAACGGFLLGLAENLALWRFDPQWSEAVTFVVAVPVHHLPAVRLLRPAAHGEVRRHDVGLRRQPARADLDQRDPRGDAQFHPRLRRHLLDRACAVLRRRRLRGHLRRHEARPRLHSRDRVRHAARGADLAGAGAAGAARARRVFRGRLARPADAGHHGVHRVEVGDRRHRRPDRHSARAHLRLQAAPTTSTTSCCRSSASSAIILIIRALVRSSFGRSLKAMRDDESAASAFGKNVAVIKTTAVVLSSALAAIAGSLYAFYLAFINVESFVLDTSVQIMAMVIIGGTATLLGPVIGTVLILLLPAGLSYLPYLPPTEIGSIQQIVYGLAMVLLMIFRPGGLWGFQEQSKGGHMSSDTARSCCR